MKICSSDNFRQNVREKFTKSRKIGSSMEYFTADFSHFFDGKRQNLAFG